MSQAGDVLGLNSVLRNSSYDTTVKTLEPCRTDFIPQAELIDLMERSHAGAHAILTILSYELVNLQNAPDLLRQILLLYRSITLSFIADESCQ